MMSNLQYKYLIVLLTGLVLFANPEFCFSQPELELKKFKKKYPNENVFILLTKLDLNIVLNESNISVYSDKYLKKFYLKTFSGNLSGETVKYSEFNQITEINASTLVPAKNKYKKIKVEGFVTKDELSNSIFHDDTKSKNFYFPALQEGAITNLHYKRHLKNPRLLESFFFSAFVPIERAEYNITCDENINLEFKFFNIDKEDLNITETKSKGKIKYSMVLNNSRKYDYEDGAPSARTYMPHVIIYINDYQADGSTKKLLASVNDLHSWYYTFIKDLNKKNSTDLKQIVDSLIANTQTELEKVKKIYYWVQDNIKYIAFEKGMDGFIPVEAETVFDSRYADCKGMSSIVTNMLNIANIESHLTWIGTRDIPYSYYEVPTPIVDNHMIATYIDGDNYYFLDATDQYTPFGYPNAFIQGKEAMIHIDSNEFKIYTVPVINYEKNAFYDTVYIKLQDMKIIGKGKSNLSGYYKNRITYRLVDKTYDKKIDFLNSFYNKGSNKFLIDSLTIENLLDREKDLIINYEFNIADYVRYDENEIFINLNLDKLYLNEEIEKDRKIDIENNFKIFSGSTTVFQIPEGYQFEYLPENKSYKNEKFGFDLKYNKSQDTVTLTVENYENYLILKKSDFKDWNDMIEQITECYNEVVIIKKY